ncbi:hypothetical protein VZT92_005676 [Zoarces viviparus]|uniref:Uncharacterized protein n=1 Tax=Zoarces viviparus TaxID=48416 RepID=A0AAW1FVH8_ZOAVI
MSLNVPAPPPWCTPTMVPPHHGAPPPWCTPTMVHPHHGAPPPWCTPTMVHPHHGAPHHGAPPPVFLSHETPRCDQRCLQMESCFRRVHMNDIHMLNSDCVHLVPAMLTLR